jgi:hypothetical protein
MSGVHWRAWIVVVAVVSACDGGGSCKDVVTHFAFHNQTADPVELFEGYEANTLQVSNDNCIEGIPAFLVDGNGNRQTVETQSICDADARVFAVSSGLPGQSCVNSYVTITRDALKSEIFVTATYVGASAPEPLVVEWVEQTRPEDP